ncbi:MAG: amidase family protein, partial [Chloroflexi bacterium]|nr:amidase family protein [Chloroflexota bacterium]
MSDDPALWSATRQAAAIRKGELSSRELLGLHRERFERINPALNAIVTEDFESASAAADAADAALRRGDAVGPLHGLSITIKDALQTAGMRSTGGATELAEHVPQHDAPTVAALKAAGAIVFGKTNLPRWSGDVQAFNPMFGTTVNPWNADRVPGGSSGGAAAAVAAGLTSFEIGTDIGGSIRIPASFCGVFGHKPSFGLVPSTGYLDHVAGGTIEADVNVIGPLARSAEDLELLLKVLVRQAQPWVADLAAPPADITSLRVAAWLDDAFCPVDGELLAVLSDAADALEASGVAVDRAARPALDPREASALGMSLVGAATSQSSGNDAMSHREWLDHHAAREGVRARWAEFFQRYDAVLMPVTFVPAFPHQQDGTFQTRALTCNGESRRYAEIVSWTILTGMAYLPATVPPLGLTKSGLPVGVQVVGPYGADLRTIRLAGHLAALGGGYQPPP